MSEDVKLVVSICALGLAIGAFIYNVHVHRVLRRKMRKSKDELRGLFK